MGRRLALATAVLLAVSATPASSELSATPAARSGVVVVLVGGATWRDAPPEIGGWARASLVLHSVTAGRTALDTYLTIAKGRRTRGPRDHELGVLEPRGDGVHISNWDELRRLDRTFRYGGHLGALGDQLERHGVPRTLVTADPTAAAVAADGHGDVPAYVPYLPGTLAGRDAVRRAVAGTRGVRFVETPLDSLADVLGAVDQRCTVLASASSPGRTPQLGMIAVSPACGLGTGRLAGGAARRPGYVLLPDLAPTILRLAGVAPPSGAFDGEPLATSGTVSIARLRADNRRSLASGRATRPVAWLLVGVEVAAVASVLVSRRTTSWATALAGSLPASTLLVTATPWVRWGTAGAVVAIALLTAALAVAGLLVARGDRCRLVGVLALATTLVVGLDGATGGGLELDSPVANNAIGAGRFSGIGNVPFGFLAGSALVAATVAVGRWGRRALWPATAGLVLVALVDGAPFLGADVGGMLALLPAIVLFVLVAGQRLTLRRLLRLGGAAALLVAALAAIDLARGAGGSHLARVLRNGDLWGTVVRKEQSALGTFRSQPLGLLVLLGAVVLAAGWRRLPPGPAVRAGVWSITGLVVLGTFLNDSGSAVGGAVVAAAIPGLIVAAVVSDGVRPSPASATAPAPAPPPPAVLGTGPPTTPCR
jgi:hypothetical protein